KQMQNACCDCLLQMQVANACNKANATYKCLQQTKYNLQMLAAKQMQPANACNKANATCKMLAANASCKCLQQSKCNL
ncbi:hypothetical protein Tco_0334727, partial [Tanacetum coccineum]